MRSGGACGNNLQKTDRQMEIRIKQNNIKISKLRNLRHLDKQYLWYVEIKCQLDATEVFIADLIACSTCFGHHYAHHQELKSIIQWLLPVVFLHFYSTKYHGQQPLYNTLELLMMGTMMPETC